MKHPKDFRVLLVYPELQGMLVLPLSIGLFTAILKRAGYQVALFDTAHYVTDETISPANRVKFLQARAFDYGKDLRVRWKTDLFGDFRRTVDSFRPDLLVVTSVEDTWLQAVALLACVDDLRIPSICGGVFVTAVPEKAITFQPVHMIGIGDGEEIVALVAERVRQGASCVGIPGVWVKREDGSILKTPRGPVVDINVLPVPDFSLFEESRFYRPMGGKVHRTIPLETYRGCPYACSFCNSPMQWQLSRAQDAGNFLRRKPISGLRREITELIATYDPGLFYIVDDSFLARPEKEIEALAAMYAEFRIPFWMNTRPETITSKTLGWLREMNCYRMSLGLEAGNETYRDRVLHRKMRNEKLLEHFGYAAEGGVTFSINNIIGYPDETRDLVLETIMLNRQLRGFDSLTVSIFTPYHGTELRRVAEQKGYLDPGVITTHTTSSSLLHMPAPYLSRDEIDQLMRTFPLYVHLDRARWPEIAQAETDDRTFARLQEEFQRSVWGTDPDRGGMP